MIQAINLSDFRNAFHQMGRGEQFSYEALELIFNHLEQYEEDTGEQIELDVIAICCDFEEAHYSDVIGQYETEICDHFGEDVATPEEEQIEYIRDWLADNTCLIGETPEGSFLFQSF